MKKNKLFLLALATLLASCQMEMTEISQFPRIIAEIENQSETRTQLSVDESGVGTIYWKPADRIDVFFGTSRAVYTSQNNENATNAIFQTGDSVSGADISSTNIWGLYPSNDSSTCDGNSVTTTLPSQQYGIPESFDDDLFITLAHSNSTTLQFYNVCGGIKFSLSRDDITAISFKGNDNEDVVGKVNLSFSNDFPNATVVNGFKEITLTPKTGQTFSKDVNYYIATLPTTLSNGFTMTFTTTDGAVGTLNYTEKAITLKRSIFSRQKQIDSFATFEGGSQPNNVIYYTSSDGQIVTPYKTNGFGANIVSNEYVDGRGVITFDGDVTAIGNDAFYKCTGLVSIEIPNSVTSIGETAFENCTGLVSIEIPSSVTSIGEGAFAACSGLTSIVVDSDNPTFDSRNDCNAIIETNSNILIVGCQNAIIPNTVTGIGDYAFSYCTGLASVEIPYSVTSIGEGAFAACSGLTSIVVDPDNPAFDSRNDCNAIIETNSNTLIAGCQNTIIPNTVISIGAYAFCYCSGLTSIEIPNSVKSIYYAAFAGCSGLTYIEIPSSVTRVADQVFRECSSLVFVDIPDSVTSIGTYAFFRCYSLTSVVIPASVETIYPYAFTSCTNLDSITCLAPTPPVLSSTHLNQFFENTNNCPIYVPAESLDIYEQEWSRYADRIFPIASPSDVTDLSKNGTANCYLAPKNGKYSFKATVKGNSTTSIGVPTAARAVWETFNTSNPPSVGDVVTDVEFIDGRISFNTTDYEGNALIAAIDENGTILWSWHIWVTDYDPKTDYDTYVGYEGIKVMDRNLGALSDQPGTQSFGMLYQWGRKEPFMGSTGTERFASTSSTKSTQTSSNTGTDSYAIHNPTTIINASGQGGDWRYVSNATAWSSNKTELDPCPNGWKVPEGGTSGLWKNFVITNSSTWSFDRNNKGMLFGSDYAYSSVWMPAQGFKYDIQDSIGQVGVEGRYWTSTAINNQYSEYFEFKSNSTCISHNNVISYCSRANGEPVRCVEDK